jgi:DNA-binding winged helix-turn-helix (wHTH) protein
MPSNLVDVRAGIDRLVVSHRGKVAVEPPDCGPARDELVTLTELGKTSDGILRLCEDLGYRWSPGHSGQTKSALSDTSTPQKEYSVGRGLLELPMPGRPSSDQLSFADLTMDEHTFEVWRNETPIYLSQTEFRLLSYLIRYPNAILSKSRIRETVWQGRAATLNLVEAYVSLLRKKIDTLGPPLIHTVRGVGYSLRLPFAGSLEAPRVF